MTRIDAVLFDWGDTLFESPHAPSVILETARARGVTMDARAAEEMWRSLWDASKTAEEHAKGRDLSREAHRRVWVELFARENASIPGIDRALYDGVMDPTGWKPYLDSAPTLRALRDRGLRIGIVSNHAFDLRPFFKTHGLDRFIDGYVLSYEVGAAKPSARIFAEATRMLGIAAQNTLMVGDDAVSDGGAAAAGMQVYILPPYEHGAARGLGHVVELVDRSRSERS
ncbi:MAG TPA: HAD-IA family hydrolase [Candidatus Limnocylindrales bacterium]|nr:HAD-IA family hydrolase [Candidatus Limnocylindrales bacterium]